MHLYVGASGYAYKEWKGSFYPEDLPAKQMLPYYAARFRTVEINNTFYRLPKASVVTAWAEQTPADFKFVLKAPQRITHFQRLKDSQESVGAFVGVARFLEARMGPLFFQLPPNLKKDAARLREFLLLLPQDIRAAFEFRHASWFDDEVYTLLREYRAALCIAEDDGELDVPFVATTDWGYLRLRRSDYDNARLKACAARVQQQDWRDVFVFFKHEDEGKAPQFAEQFLKLAE